MNNKQKKCSETQKGRMLIHFGNEERRIYANEFSMYEQLGWSKGMSEEHRQSCSKSKVGRPSKNKGVSKSEETRSKISNSLKGNKPWNKGLTKDDDRVKNNTDKATATKIKKYGSAFANNNMNEEHKQKISNSLNGRHYGEIPKDKLKKILDKKYETHKKNNSFNTSDKEDELYESLKNEHIGKTILRNYKDLKRYPFYCDFYIVEDDLFIELNAHWTHGGRPYDKDNAECQEQLAVWEEKAKTSQFYKNAIETWTIRDVKKLECAKKNNLNYKVIY